LERTIRWYADGPIARAEDLTRALMER